MYFQFVLSLKSSLIYSFIYLLLSVCTLETRSTFPHQLIHDSHTHTRARVGNSFNRRNTTFQTHNHQPTHPPAHTERTHSHLRHVHVWRMQLLLGQAVRGHRRMWSDLCSWIKRRASLSPISHRMAFSTNPGVVSLKLRLRRPDRWNWGLSEPSHLEFPSGQFSSWHQCRLSLLGTLG